MFNEDKMCHHMHIQHIISMFEEKTAQHFDEILFLKGNLYIFSLLKLNIRLFIYMFENMIV